MIKCHHGDFGLIYYNIMRNAAVDLLGIAER